MDNRILDWLKGMEATDLAPAYTLENLALTLLLGVFLGQVVAWVYMWTHTGVSYTRSFTQSLVLLTIVVSLVMFVIGNSIVTAFGLIGVALYLQHGLDMLPCPLCVIQRYLFLAIGAVEWLTMSRIVRGQVLSLRRQEFIEAAIALGIPRWRIIWRHIIPNCLGPVIVYTTLTIPVVMLLEAFLSFLGLGVQPPDPSWGLMISEGKGEMLFKSWMIVLPGGALFAMVLAVNMLGDGIRDVTAPENRN